MGGPYFGVIIGGTPEWRKAPEGGLESSENTCVPSQLDRHFLHIKRRQLLL
jgi:hypothetical protein